MGRQAVPLAQHGLVRHKAPSRPPANEYNNNANDQISGIDHFVHKHTVKKQLYFTEAVENG